MKPTFLNVELKLLCFSAFILLCISSSSKAQNIQNIVREFKGSSIIVEGVSISPAEIQGQLFYSKKQKGLISNNYKSFKEDNSLLVVCPLIRVYKNSESNFSLSISLQTIDKINGKEKRTTFHSMFERTLNISKIINEVGKKEIYIIIDGDDNKTFTPIEKVEVNYNNSEISITYLDRILGGLNAFKYKMNGINITIKDGTPIN